MLQIIIPTRNRNDFLERLLNYFSKVGCEFEILIADSSSETARVKNENTIAELSKSLRIKYYHFNTEISVEGKVFEALNHVNSKYSVLCADDDFLIPNTLKQCIEFLENYKDYSVAHGKSVMVGFGKSSIIVNNYPQRNIEDEDAGLRLINHLGSYSTTFYSIQKTETLKHNWDSARKYTSDILFGELLPSCLSIVQGKSKSLDSLYMVRQYHENSTATLNLSKVYADLFSNSEKLEEAFSSFQYSLTEEMKKCGYSNESEIRENISDAFWSFISDQQTQDYIIKGIAEKSGIGQEIIKEKIKSTIEEKLKWKNNGIFKKQLKHESALPLDIFSLLSADSQYRKDFLPAFNAMIESPGWS